MRGNIKGKGGERWEDSEGVIFVRKVKEVKVRGSLKDIWIRTDGSTMAKG